jgi:hypothetical protein
MKFSMLKNAHVSVIAYLISFSMAFLLFVVQPMATKVILPQFGGTPGVWNTAMLFFQTLLLLGYLYAHVLSSILKPKWQIITHAALIAVACIGLPIAFQAPEAEVLSNTPIRALIWQLFAGVGIPFFAVSATAPLLQRWISYSNTSLAEKPYVLYSASNLGSMSALIGYILLIEPNATISFQMMGWGYFFIAVSAVLVIFAYMISGKAEGQKQSAALGTTSAKQSLFWIFLAFIPSSLSLGLTTHITTDIASVPFFWVIPFAIYLLSFVDAFANKPRIFPIAKYIAPVLGIACLFALASNFMVKHTEVMLIHLGAFAFIAFAIHGHLAARKPAIAHLTWYYVCLSIGGALGGMFNAIAAPMLLNSTFEYPLVMFLATAVSYMLLRARQSSFNVKDELRFMGGLLVGLVVITAIIYVWYALFYDKWEQMTGHLDGGAVSMGLLIASIAMLVLRRSTRTIVYSLAIAFILIIAGANMSTSSIVKERNFYGVSRVYISGVANATILQHNTTVHGLQSLDPEFKLAATSYYGGLDEIMGTRLKTVANEPIGAIGLGIGVVKCKTKPKQHMDIFEINPLVVRLAEDKTIFTYLSDCPGEHDIVLGDGRLTMAQMPSQKYGTIIIDAFSSDAIPVHLLTKEAFAMYLDKLKDGGIIAIHITNRHLDLRPLLAAQAEDAGLVAYTKFFNLDGLYHYNAFWVVMARSDATLAEMLGEPGWSKLVAKPDAKPWTDDYTNILPYLSRMR